MKKLLLASIATVALCGAPALSADMPTKASVKADPESLLDFTVAFGGTWNSGPSVRSSSGFYTGDINSFGGITGSIAATVPIGKAGIYDVRFGPKIEWMQGSFHFKGLAGGVQETLPGHMTQWDYLATLLFSTKIAPGRELYFGPVAGYAVVSTHGTPCIGCPQYKDPGAPVLGAYVGVWDRWSDKVDVGYGLEYRATGSINNKTTDPFENFHNGVNHTVMATVGFTFDASDLMYAAVKSGFGRYTSPLPPPPPTPPR
jgi:hypothetical protein